MGERRTVRQRQPDAVEAAAAAEGQRAGLGRRRLGGERGRVVEPGAVGAAPETRLPQRGAGRPGEVHGDRVVVGQDAAVGLQELGAVIAPVRGGQVEDGAAAVEDLVDGLAVVGRARVRADRLGGGDGAAVDEIYPGVCHVVLLGEDADAVAGSRVPAVGIAIDENSVTNAAGVDGVRYLLKIGGSRGYVGSLGARVCMQVVDVDVHAIVDRRTHERVSLGRQAIVLRRIAASIPLDALEVDPVKVGQGIEPGTERNAAGSSRAVSVRVRRVDVGVIVEILHFAFSSDLSETMVCAFALLRSRTSVSKKGVDAGDTRHKDIAGFKIPWCW